MDDDTRLFDWIRHYGSLIALAVLLGVALAATWLAVSPRPFEAWTIIVQSGDLIPSVELGPTATSVFRSEAVYEPAIDELGLDLPPSAFLDRRAELRPVPETATLIVIGRSDDPDQARAIADAMMRSFVDEFESRDLGTFELFGRAEPTRLGVGTPVALAAGAVAGFWLGLAVGVVHYRVRDPVLTMSGAVRWAPAQHLAVVPGGGRPWLGLLRRVRGWRRTPRALGALGRLAEEDGASGEDAAESLSRDLGRALEAGDAVVAGGTNGLRAVLVAHAGTPGGALRQARSEVVSVAEEPLHVDLVWVR